MSQIRKIFTNMSWLMISQIITSICGFIWTILTARYLGVDEYGILGFAMSLTGVLYVTLDWGTGTHVIRHISTDHDSAPKYIGNSFALRSIFAIGNIILTLIILILLKCDEMTVTVTLLIALEMIFKSFCNFINGSFQAFEEGKYQGIGNSLMNILLLIFILISVFTDLGIYAISFSYILSNLLALFYLYYSLRKHIVKPKFELDLEFCKKITVLSLPFAATGVLYLIYYSIDVVMLTNMVGNYATGIYNAAYKLISVLTAFYSVYLAVIFPLMSRLFKNDKKILITSYEKSIKYLMLFMIPLALATTIYSGDIIELIYGQEYAAASSVLSILIWTVCFLFVSGAGNNLLNASYKEVTLTKIYGITAMFNVVLNFILIPILSFNGAAITTVLSDALMVLIQIYVIRKLGYKINKKLYFDLSKIILGSIILGAILHILNLNMWVALPVGIIIYFTTVYLLKVFDDDDKHIIKEILNKN